MTPEQFYSDSGVVGCKTLEQFGEIIRRRYRNTWPDYPGMNPEDYRPNSLGFRGPEFLAEVNTCYYGCSFTYGQGVSLAERSSALVDQARSWTSNNFALPALGPQAISDIFLATTRFCRMEQAVIVLPTEVRVSLPLELDGISIWHYCPGADINSMPKTVQQTVRTWLDLPSAYYYDQLRSAVDRIELVAELQGIRTVYSSWDWPVFDYLKSRGLRTTQELWQADGQGRDQIHPGPAAHQRFAEQLLAVV